MATPANANSILNVFDRLGADYPKPVADVLERQAKVRATQAKVTSASVLDAALTALGVGKSPVADPAFIEAVAAERLETVSFAIDQHLTVELNATLADNATPIVNAWTPPFNERATRLQACHQALHGAALDDSAAVLRLGGDSAEVWANARQITEELHHLATGWRALRLLQNLTADQRSPLGAWVSNRH